MTRSIQKRQKKLRQKPHSPLMQATRYWPRQWKSEAKYKADTDEQLRR